MREIFFRGKRTDNSEWVEGYLCRKYFQELPHDRCAIMYKTEYDTKRWQPDYMTAEVIPSTIGQYTGINVGSEKLFEGDIVECHEDYDDSWGFSKTSVVRAVVVWDEENFCWAFEIEKKYRQPFNDWTWDNSFINGNIHDNPELPKGGC